MSRKDPFRTLDEQAPAGAPAAAPLPAADPGADLFVRRVESIEADGAGSMIRLACQHLLWCALPPSEFASQEAFYCATCLHDALESLRQAESAGEAANDRRFARSFRGFGQATEGEPHA